MHTFHRLCILKLHSYLSKVTTLTLLISNPASLSSLFSEPRGALVGAPFVTGRLFPQAAEGGGYDEPRPPRQWLWAWPQADFTLQWTHPESLSAWERPPKESQRLAGTPSGPTRGLAVAGWNFIFFALGNKTATSYRGELSWASLNVDWHGAPGGGGVVAAVVVWTAGGIRSLKAELVWAASHLSVSAVHS